MKTLSIILLLFATLVLTNTAAAQERWRLREGSFISDVLGESCHDLALDHSTWQQGSLYGVDEYQHYCLRIPVHVDEVYEDHPVLLLAVLGSARVYWDGEWVADKGVPGIDLKSEVVGPLALQVPLSQEQLAMGKHWISMELSTYHHDEDLYQIVYTLEIVSFNDLLDFQRSLIVPLLLSGAMFLLALYFGMLYWRYQRQVTFIVFGLLCLMSGILILLELLKFYWNYPWDFHLVRLRIIVPVVAVNAWLLVAYYLSFFKYQAVGKKLLWFGVLLLVIALFTPSYDGKSLVLFVTSIGASLAVSIQALKMKRKEAKLHVLILILGMLLLVSLPFTFIDQWFAALFAMIALANLFSLTGFLSQEKELALQTLRLESELLRKNLQPHFLMNSLTLIMEWVETKPALALDFISELADEFRLLNRISQKKLVAWSDERHLCELHFAVMQKRMQKRIHLLIEDVGLSFLLPPAVVHSLIENAFSHNRVVDDDEFGIRVRKEAGKIYLEVRCPYRKHEHHGQGTGERYIRSRLQQSFPERWQFDACMDGQVWLSRMCFPDLEGKPCLEEKEVMR